MREFSLVSDKPTVDEMNKLIDEHNAVCKVLLLEILNNGETPETTARYDTLKRRGTRLADLGQLVMTEARDAQRDTLLQSLTAADAAKTSKYRA